jgi:20S proteasome alpha/beta subunit
VGASAAASDPASTALALHHELYSHRGFPYYAFCLVAGLTNPARCGDDVVTGGGSDSGAGSVYVYDAIGSYEQVAVASAGSGREYLQPILDRLFSSEIDRDDATDTADSDGGVAQQHYIRCCASPKRWWKS